MAISTSQSPGYSGASFSPRHQQHLSTAVANTGRSPSPAFPLQARHSSASPSQAAQSEAPPPAKRRRVFHRELKYMMHGFGDDANPYEETVDLVEDLVIEFVTEMTHKAMEVGKNGKVSVNDIIFIVRKDPKKFSRVKDLLMMDEEVRKARKAVDGDVSAHI